MEIDSCCGMKVDEKKADKENLVVVQNKEKFYFCSKKCKEDFIQKSHPYPDHCAECMKQCNLTKTIWKIKHKGALYCFDSEKCKEKFQKKRFGEVLY
ncbi:hypothetical protein HYX11_00035 [Candidatus Woesearchaeota archaeon]|nr:hypothetical protein [Candidatus Woesearchaeota archaeon]